MKRNFAPWLIAALIAARYAGLSPRVKATESPLPSWMVVGACYEAPGTRLAKILEIEGTWVKENANSINDVWRNMAATPLIVKLNVGC